jgi:hypothetical protein
MVGANLGDTQGCWFLWCPWGTGLLWDVFQVIGQQEWAGGIEATAVFMPSLLWLTISCVVTKSVCTGLWYTVGQDPWEPLSTFQLTTGRAFRHRTAD